MPQQEPRRLERDASGVLDRARPAPAPGACSTRCRLRDLAQGQEVDTAKLRKQAKELAEWTLRSNPAPYPRKLSVRVPGYSRPITQWPPTNE